MKRNIFQITLVFALIILTISCEDKNPENMDFFFSGKISSLTVSTGTISNITTTSAKCEENFYNAQNITVKEVGVCWSSFNPIPTYDGSNNYHASLYSNISNSFAINLTGLLPFTKYYVRAYAINSNNEKVYASENSIISFTTKQIEVIADYTYTASDLYVSFTNISTNALTYKWDFGDGLTSTATNPTHTYTASGTYPVSLTAYNGSIQNVKSKNVTVTTSSSQTTDVTFTNKVFTPITITMNGITYTFDTDESVTFYNLEGTSMLYYAYTNGALTDGTRIGDLIEWQNDPVDLTGGSLAFNLTITSSKFFIYITNNSNTYLHNMYVNSGYGTQYEKFVDIEVPNTGIPYETGYFDAYSNSNVTFYRKDDETSYTWYQGTQFTLSTADNQFADLKYPYNSSKSFSVSKYPVVQQIQQGNLKPRTKFLRKPKNGNAIDIYETTSLKRDK
jgi:PKD repeat protein